MSDLIAQIEKLNKQNHFSSIKYNGEYVWPYLRILLGLSFKKEVKTKLSKKILIKGIFYGFYDLRILIHLGIFADMFVIICNYDLDVSMIRFIVSI